MAITNPQAVKFCNEKARVLADQFVSLYETARSFLNLWTAGNVATIIPDNGSETVVDGSESDGRFPIDGAKVNALVNAATALVTWGDAVVGGKTRIARFREIAVNGQARF